MSTYGYGSDPARPYNVTTTPSGSFGGESVDNIRRQFGIGDYVSELAPESNIFFTYLSKVAKAGIDDTVWKPLEYRTQWQRRNVMCVDTDDVALTDPATTGPMTGTVTLKCNYDGKGKMNSDPTLWNQDPIFLLVGQVIRLATNDSNQEYKNFKITVKNSAASVDIASVETYSNGDALSIVKDKEGQVVGSAFAEASGAPDGWRDELSAVEFYTQIFKTSVPLMSGSAMATRYRGYADEWKRIYAQHVLSHKMDIEHAMLFGHGNYVDKDTRYSWGILPFIETKGGKMYDMNMSADGFDAVVDIMQDFFAPEIGNSNSKLCLTSREVIAWLSKIGNSSSSSFLYNTYGDANTPAANPYSVQVSNNSSKFAPVPITAVSTCFGTFNFVAHPLFRGMAAKTCAVIDMANVKYRPLVGNGLSRDTFVETNIQDNSTDGRKDQIITECGLEVLLPETHAIINFTT
jgi:hypothetical protein